MSPLVQKIPLVALALLLIWFPSNALASVIKLNSGKTIEREITYRDDEMIKVDSGYGIDITYYFDEIESIDGQPPILIEESVAIDMLIVEPEPIEVIDIVDEVEPLEEIEEIGDEGEVEILEPIVIEKVIEDTLLLEKEIPIVESEPVKDISVIEEQNQIKELPSPFGPTIRENNIINTKRISLAQMIGESLPKAQIMDDQQELNLSQTIYPYGS